MPGGLPLLPTSLHTQADIFSPKLLTWDISGWRREGQKLPSSCTILLPREPSYASPGGSLHMLPCLLASSHQAWAGDFETMENYLHLHFWEGGYYLPLKTLHMGRGLSGRGLAALHTIQKLFQGVRPWACAMPPSLRPGALK